MEIYDVQNYTIFREDLEIEGSDEKNITYYWDLMSFVIKNVPTLPFEEESAKIVLTVYNRSDSRLSGGIIKKLGSTEFSYRTQAQKTLQVGGVIERDFHPRFNRLNVTEGNYMNIIKLWWQQASNVKEGSYVLLDVPQDITFEFEPIAATDTASWVNNIT